MTTDADLQAPFIAPDGLEYGRFADFLVQEPLQTWRNEHVQEARRQGRSEKAIREWIKGYDGDDPRTTGELSTVDRAKRLVEAVTRIDPYGLGHGLTAVPTSRALYDGFCDTY